MANSGSFRDLLRLLKDDTRLLLRQELQLAKTELAEKFSRAGRGAILLIAGGLSAYAGLMVLLIGLGWLVAWALATAGLQPMFAAFVGLAAVGLLVALVGGLVALVGLKAFTKKALAPERTLATLRELPGMHGQAPEPAPAQPAEKPSSEQMQARIEDTETRMEDTLGELGRRVNPRHINQRIKQRIQTQPYGAGAVALGVGVVSGLMLSRRRHRGA